MQQNPILSYFSKISIFAICVCFLFLFAALILPKEFFSENIPYYVVMFYSLTALSYLSLYYLPSKTKMNFIHVFLITKVLKFLVYIGVLVIIFLFKIETNAKFAISYFLLFIFFLVFDTITTNKLSRKEAEKEIQNKKTTNEKSDKNE